MKTKMWHEARKQEKKIRGILVDYRKRAERRHDFYEAIKADPNQFLRLHGVKCRIHLDLTTENNDSALIPWQGQPEVMIDRFDVRTHLDFIAPAPKRSDIEESSKETEERQLNYERYRVLVQNEFLGVNEEKFLQQLQIEEQFGVNNIEDKSKKKPQGGATIGFQYDDNYIQPFSQTISNIEATSSSYSRYEEFAKDSSDSDLDLNLDMKKITNVEAHGLNGIATRWGMVCNDFYSFLTKDIDDAETLKLEAEQEQEKMLYCGRKGRRERRAQRERRFNIKLLDADTKPSYALDDNKLMDAENKPDSSRSPSPETTEKITYITSFGGEDEHGKKMTFSEKVKENLGALKKMNEVSKRNARRRRGSSSSSNERYRYRKRPNRSSNEIKSRERRDTRRRSNGRSRSTSSSSSSASSDRERKSNSNFSHVNTISQISIMDEQSGKEIGNKTETVIKRYYGRRRDNSDTSDLEDGDSDEKFSNNQLSEVKPCIATTVGKNYSTNPKPSTSGNSKSAMNARDVLKRKMQILLNKQYKEDKKLETMKKIQQLQEQKERESEMRELALKLRKRQRELRHRNSTPEDSENSDSSKQGDTLVKPKLEKKHDRSRTKSPVRRRTRSTSRSKKSRSSSADNRSSYRSRSPRHSRDRPSSHYRRHRSRSRSRSYHRRDRNRSYDRRYDRNKYSRRSRSRR